MGMKKALLYYYRNKNVEPKQNSQQYGNVLSMMFSAYGTLTDKQGNNFQPTMRFTAEISAKEISFLDTVGYKRKRFQNEAFLDIAENSQQTD